MKKPLLVLLALLALAPAAQLMAQTPPAAVPPANSAAVAAPPASDIAQFLATLSDKPSQAPSDLVPAPLFMTACDPACPTGEICCNLCGNPPDDGGSCLGCTVPWHGRCPPVV